MISKNQSLTPNSLKDSLSKSHQNSSILKQRLRKININKEVMKKWKVTPLSSDHKPINEERNRILATGFGSVDRLEDHKGDKHGPFRVFDQYGLDGGLAMSRSIGDHKLTKSGVIANPEFSEHKITEDDKFLIIASDGIWEYLSNEDILHLMHKTFYEQNTQKVHHRSQSCAHRSSRMDKDEYQTKEPTQEHKIQTFCENLVKVAKYYWLEDNKNYCDDITVMVIMLNPLH